MINKKTSDRSLGAGRVSEFVYFSCFILSDFIL